MAIGLAGTIQGQNTAMLGLEADRSPICVAAGVDAVVDLPQVGGGVVPVPIR